MRPARLPRPVALLRRRRLLAPEGPLDTTRLPVSLYATAGAELTGVTVDGVPSTALVGAELGHPIFTLDVEIPPGESQVLRFKLIEPASAAAGAAHGRHDRRFSLPD